MAVSTAITTLQKALKWAEYAWKTNGYNVLTDLRSFATAHTHTGGVDGTLIPLTGLTNSSITPSKLTTAANSRAVITGFIDVADAAGDLNQRTVFVAPVACTVSAVYIIPNSAVIPAAAYGISVTAELYSTAGAVTGTFCKGSYTAGTLTAFVAKSLGSITSGVMAAGEILTLRKGTYGAGTVIGLCKGAVVWSPN
jgi:hypothetical protein